MKKSKVAMVAVAVLLATSVGGNVYQYIQIRDMQATITASTVKIEEQSAEIRQLTELVEEQAAEIEGLAKANEEQATEIKRFIELKKEYIEQNKDKASGDTSTTEPSETVTPPAPPKPVTPPAVVPGGEGDWGAVMNGGGTEGAGSATYDNTDDFSHVTGNEENPFK